MTDDSPTYKAGEQTRSRVHDGPRRFFNTAGPMIPADHYHVPPLERLDLDEVLLLIEQKRYFVLHAPRQTGKTSALLALLEELNGSGRYRCVYVNVEIAQSAREDVEEAMRAILNQTAYDAETALDDRFVAEIWPGILERAGPHGVLQEVLGRWAADNPWAVIIGPPVLSTMASEMWREKSEGIRLSAGLSPGQRGVSAVARMRF